MSNTREPNALLSMPWKSLSVQVSKYIGSSFLGQRISIPLGENRVFLVF